jgi:type 1 glutamine amidotransferase
MRFLKISTIMVAALLAALAGVVEGQVNDGKCRVLILSGSNNHDWKTTTPELKRILEESGMFDVDVTDAPTEIQPDSLGKYKALISNWNTFGAPKPVTWPQPLKDAFTNFIQQGGGFVVMHAGSSVLYDWPDFQRLAGASWGKGTGHGPKHKFQVKVMDKEHPITAGMADFETTDELWHRISTNNVLHVLATAFSAKDKGGSGQDEPVAFTTQWGNGRCFNIVLGHDTGAMATSGFRELIVRGTEWAATGRVAGKAK